MDRSELPGPLEAERSVRLRREPSTILLRSLEALDDMAQMAVPQGYGQQRALDAANRLRAEIRGMLL
jgi:hypothetical protein